MIAFILQAGTSKTTAAAEADGNRAQRAAERAEELVFSTRGGWTELNKAALSELGSVEI